MISYTYEPGSTMKIFSFMSAMEDGQYNGDELYRSGNIIVDEYKISDWNKYGWGNISFDVGFTYSSNVAAVNLVQKLGRRKLVDYYTNLGFGNYTGIELSNELQGDVSLSSGSNSQLASASYGQGVSVTPIQMIQALTTLTNDGVVLKPYIISKIVNANTGETEYVGKRTEVKKVYSTATVTKMVDLLDKTVNSEDPIATGKRYASSNVRLIGKTGTANYTDPNTGEYVKGDRYVVRSFAGVFPKDNPEYIIYLAAKDFNGAAKEMGGIVKNLVESVAKYKNIEERESEKDPTKIVTIGNYQSAPILSSIAKLNDMGIQPVVIGNGSNVIKQYPAKNTKTSVNSKVLLLTNGNVFTMPNVIGYSSKDIIAFCNMIGLKYELNGYGYVESTSVPEGTVINPEDVLYINLKTIEPEKLADGGNKKDKKKTNILTKINSVINNPKSVIIFLIIVLTLLTISLVRLKNSNKFYYSELQLDDLTIADIQYYETPTLAYFFSNNAVYGGEDASKDVTYIRIGYYVKINDDYKKLDVYETPITQKVTLSEAVMAYSKFKISDFKKNNKIFTKEIRNNMNNLYFKIEASTNKDNTIDINKEYKVNLTKING